MQQATVTCDGSDRVTYEVRTDGWTADDLFNAMETANASQWDDEHDVLF